MDKNLTEGHASDGQKIVRCAALPPTLGLLAKSWLTILLLPLGQDQRGVLTTQQVWVDFAVWCKDF